MAVGKIKKDNPVAKIQVDEIEVDIHRRKVKNLRLIISATDATVKMIAPLRASGSLIDGFLRSKLPWIRKHRQRITRRERPPEFTGLKGQTVFVQGIPYTFVLVPATGKTSIEKYGDTLQMHTQPGTTASQHIAFLNQWYRKLIKKEISGLIRKWEPVIGVSVNEFGVRQMRTKWGTCNIRDKRIWLNLELIKKSPECLEYVVVHEMVHLLERYHNKNFYSLMDRFLPQWKECKTLMNGID